MPKAVSFKIPRTSDRLLIERVREFITTVADPFQRLEVQTVYGDQFAIDLSNVKPKTHSALIVESDGVLTSWLRFQFADGFTINVNRENEWTDGVTVEPGQVPSERFGERLLAAKKSLKEFVPSIAAASVVSSDIANQYKAREQHLGKREDQLDEFFRRMEDYSLKLTDEVQKHKATLDADLQKRKGELEAAHAQRMKALDERQATLDKLKEEIDFRENRSVRRDIHKQLKKKLEERNTKFELTPGTVKMRKVIFWTSIALMALFGGTAALLVFQDLYYGGEINPWRVGRQITFTLAFGFTAIFFIRWNQQWFRMHADEEFRLKKMDLDIDRASWLVEMSLEWKNEKGGTEIPADLLNKLSGDLFTPTKPDTSHLHPADMVASTVFGAASEMTLKGAGGSELKLNRRGIQQLQKSDGKE